MGGSTFQPFDNQGMLATQNPCRKPSTTREGIQNSLRVLSKVDPKFAKLKAEDLIDDRIARKLD